MAIKVSGLRKSFGALTVMDSVSFEVAGHELVTLLGPSGCGKTTTLRCIAGLEEPEAGVIEIDGRVVTDAARGVSIPTQERRLGMVFQSYAVWPHMTVAQNVAFPLEARGLRDVKAQVRWALGVVGMEGLADRRPSQLSGGQQQRVALARAIVGEPKLLLFDEPLSNLDAKLRDRTRAEISRIQRELAIPAIYVTHDQVEALALSDRVIVMQSGRIEQQGTPRELYDAPVSRFVAGFVGQASFLPLVGDGAGWRAPDGARVAATGGLAPSRDERAVAMLRPEAVTLSPRDTAMDPRLDNDLPGVVREAVYLGQHVEHLVEAAGAELRAFSRQELAPGTPVRLGFSAADCRLLPEAS